MADFTLKLTLSSCKRKKDDLFFCESFPPLIGG
jgi:hypothetical protein